MSYLLDMKTVPQPNTYFMVKLYYTTDLLSSSGELIALGKGGGATTPSLLAAAAGRVRREMMFRLFPSQQDPSGWWHDWICPAVQMQNIYVGRSGSIEGTRYDQSGCETMDRNAGRV